MSKYYDATTEHKRFEIETKKKGGGHPNKGVKGKNPYSGKEVR